MALFLVLLTLLSSISLLDSGFYWVIFGVMIIPLYATELRYKLITRHILNFYRAHMPTMSSTESEALAAGTVGWEGELFQGNPNWEKLLNYPKPTLSEEERDFLDGPVKALMSQ